MLAAILVVWFIGIPLAVIAVTMFAGWRRELMLARLEARAPVPLLAVLFDREPMALRLVP